MSNVAFAIVVLLWASVGSAQVVTTETTKCDPASKEYAAASNAVLKRDNVVLMKLSDSEEQIFVCLLEGGEKDVAYDIPYVANLINSTALSERLGEWSKGKDKSWRKLRAAAKLPRWQVAFISDAVDESTDCSHSCPIATLDDLVVPLALTEGEFAQETYKRFRAAAQLWFWREGLQIHSEFQIGDALKNLRGVRANTPIQAIRRYAPLPIFEDSPYAKLKEIARNTKGNRALIEVYTGNGEEWHIVMHKTQFGWEYESLRLVAVS